MTQLYTTSMNKNTRFFWLDWMKAITMLFIIWGHFLSSGNEYIYVFNVPVFCLISGFLYKKEKFQTFVKKAFFNLFIPMLIMSLLMYSYKLLRLWSTGNNIDLQPLTFAKHFLMGNYWTLGPCWYIYTLIIMKLILQLFPSKKWVYAVLFLLSSLSAIAIHYYGFKTGNAFCNITVALPFFIIGVLLKQFKQSLKSLHIIYAEIALLILAIFIVYLCGHYNGEVWMYMAGYGNNFALFILGGIAGTTMVFIISKWAERLSKNYMAMLISKGSIVILGLHIAIVQRLCELPYRSAIEDFAFSVLILLLFVPLIRIVEIYFPILLGKYRTGNRIMPEKK